MAGQVKVQSIAAIVIIAISSVIIVEYYTSRLNISPDHTGQYVAAKQFAEGNGLTRPVFNEDDISEPLQKIHTEWPPGISVFVAPLFYIFDDIRVIHTIASFIILLLFLFSAYFLVKELALHKPGIFVLSLALLFMTLNGRFVLMAANNQTDIVVLSFFMLSALFLIKYFKDGKKQKYLMLISLLMAASVYFRYAYFPALAALPAFFLWRIIFNKSKEHKALLYSVAYIIIFSLPFFAHIFMINMQTGYVSGQGVSRAQSLINLGGIIWTNPFAMNAFFDQFPFIKLLGYTSSIGYDRGYDYPVWLQVFFHIVSVAVLVPVFMYYRKAVKDKKYFSNSIFILYGLLVSAGLMLLILGSSVFRYFIIPVFIIQATYFLMIMNSPVKKLKYIALALFAASFLYSLTLKTYNYTYNYKPFDFQQNTSILRHHNAQYNSYNIHKNLPVCPTGSCAIIIDREAREKAWKWRSFFGLNNITTTVMDTSEEHGLDTSGPVNVYFITDDPGSGSNKKFLEKNNAELYRKLDNNINIFNFVFE